MAKICYECKILKDILEFRKRAASKDGYRGICKFCQDEYERHRYEEKSEHIKANVKAYAIANREKVLADKRQYQIDNRVELGRKKWIYIKNKIATDPVFKLKRALRKRLNTALKRKVKVGSAIADLGCTVLELRAHIEAQFHPGMSWTNYGNKTGQWSLDHIIPLSSFDLSNREEFLKACHFLNLSPMWHIENLEKANKIL